MDFFNTDIKKELQQIITNDINFKLIVLYGEVGCGKTFCMHQILADFNITVNDVIFTEECFFPSGDFALEVWRDCDENTILMACTEKLQQGECLVFQNMELCEADYKRLLHYLLKYHQNVEYPILVFLEYNASKMPQDDICELTNNIIFVESERYENFFRYLERNFCVKPKNVQFFEEIINLAHGNIGCFFSILSILHHQNILSIDSNGQYYCKNEDFRLPNDILSLYINLFDTLENHVKEPLLSAAPFSTCIYNNIVKSLFYEYNNIEIYLEQLSEYDSIISNNINGFCSESVLFQASYIFSTSYSKEAVLTKLETKTIRKTLSDYYNYFDKIYQNKKIYDSLSESDKAFLLCSLSKSKKGRFNINQIDYIIDLMNYYYKHFMYLNAIEQGDRLLKSNTLRNEQLNVEAHSFWIVYFKSLLAVGHYETVIDYIDCFEDDEINYYIALALYNKGVPLQALDILKKILRQNNQNIGYIYNLMSSIYDWIGDNKKSQKCFSRALKNCCDDNVLKFQLFKKYSMYVDFRIPECQDKMNSAIEFYRKTDLKQYAECLHNYGTQCIFCHEYKLAYKHLELAQNVLKKVCSEEVYYILNSLAILTCYNDNDLNAALDLLKKALQLKISIDFCRFAIENNIFNIYINMNNLEMAEKQKEKIQDYFEKLDIDLNTISKIRPDIQHSLRQFYYNCALLCKIQNQYKLALEYFIKSKNASSYSSIVLYSINCNIIELKKYNENIRYKIRNKSKKQPTPIEKFVHENHMYLCEVMFWG